ncbi:MAG: HEAT repeat domain-containing protein, partial [Chlamydiia bacterium]|nr:HEAT repeat domain-containing protein [Chlamydiia bacterium]
MIFFLFLIATLTLEQRTDLHLAINDPRSACEELKSAPQGAETERAWIKALSQQGNDGEMLTHWDQIAHAPDLLETVAWGILNCGANSTNPQMRTIALLATAESQDAKYLDILVKGLSDPNRIVRRIAAKLAAHFPDQKVQQALKRQLQREKDGSIRSALIASLTSKEVIQKLLEN